MDKLITVNSQGDLSVPIQISYSIDSVDDVQTIACCVCGLYPHWLQVKKFEMKSQKGKNGYVPLFNEANNSKNMATATFIDKIYEEIMHAEKFKVEVSFS